MTPLGVSATCHDNVLRIDDAVVDQFTKAGHWNHPTLSTIVRDLARRSPDDVAIYQAEQGFSWRQYDHAADAIAARLSALGLERGDRVAVLLPDTFAVHAALVGCARAGLVAMGMGARSGPAEVEHLVRVSAAKALVSLAEHRGISLSQRVADLAAVGLDVAPIEVTPEGIVDEELSVAAPAGLELLGTEISMLNSTSGTTGMPKCVTQFDLRWLHFSEIAVEAGRLRPDDVVMSVVPTPFGFGLWTSHFVGPLLGAPTVVMPKFDAAHMVELIEQHQVTVLCCVTTQFRMLLNLPDLDPSRLHSLRVMFTGGEAVPQTRAQEFEETVGASVLQFYGSNETGALSCTRIGDDPETRWDTSGHVLPHMEVRLYDDEGRVIDGVGTGQAGCRGPLTSAGYWQDDAANQELYATDGAMLIGDVVTRDAANRLVVSGRRSDVIIRGGKNISAVEVEAMVESHPAVALVAVVPVPDELFGERVCAVVTLHPQTELTLDDLVAHCVGQGVTRDWLPERLVVVAEMPQNAGGKIAKAAVRQLIAAEHA